MARADGPVLVVAAHPDDEVLGCGGTIARLAGPTAVHVAILGEGITSRHRDRADADRAALERLHEQAREAGEILGAASVTVGDLPDNRFDQVPLLEVVHRVEEIVARTRPVAIYTHSAADLNLDHVMTFRAVITATRPDATSPTTDVYAFEVPSSTEWAFGRLGRAFAPTVFVDITGTLERKLAALQRYTGEIRAFPHPRSPEALRAIAARWGSVAGLTAAEAFELIRSVRR